MGRKLTTRKRGKYGKKPDKKPKKPDKEPGKEDTVQKSFRFMDLPRELRDIVYRLAVIPKYKIVDWKPGSDYDGIMPPPLAQMNMDLDDNDNDGFVKEDYGIKLKNFLRMCSCLVNTGGLRYIKTLTINYSSPAWIDVDTWQSDICNWQLGFDGTGRGQRIGARVGNDNLDWSDYQEVETAVVTTVKQLQKYRSTNEDFPESEIIEVLFTLAKHCHYANQHVELLWDWGF